MEKLKLSTINEYCLKHYGRKLSADACLIINRAAQREKIPSRPTAPSSKYPKGVQQYEDEWLEYMTSGLERINIK